VLAAGRHRRCAACGAVRGGLQHPLAAAGRGPPGAKGPSCAYVGSVAHAGFSARKGHSGPERRPRYTAGPDQVPPWRRHAAGHGGPGFRRKPWGQGVPGVRPAVARSAAPASPAAAR
jgi:hypothetical protein